MELPLFDSQSVSRYAPAEDICSRKSGGNPESELAHEVVKAAKPELQRHILEYIAEVRGATCEEVSRALGMRYTTASARISELRKAGRLHSTGRRRPTTTGTSAAVLAVSAEATS